MVRLMLHLRKTKGQSCVERHIESMCRARDWISGTVGAPWTHSILAKCACTWIRWSECDPCSFIGRAIRWHSERYNQDTACLNRAISALRNQGTRYRVGRPHDRRLLGEGLHKEWGP